MTHFRLLLGAAVLSSLPLIGAPIACPASGTYATLIALSGPGDGCVINGLLFNNFGLTPTASGTGAVPTASQVAYNVDDPGTGTGTGELIYGFEFNPDLSVIGVGTEDTLLNYTIIATAPIISSIHLLETAVASGTAAATTAEGPDRGCTSVNSGCTFLPIVQSTLAAPHQDLLGIGPFTELDVSKDINVTSLETAGIAAISQVRDSVNLTTAATTPEPTSYVYLLAGLGLIALGRKRWRSKPY